MRLTLKIQVQKNIDFKTRVRHVPHLENHKLKKNQFCQQQ